LEGRTVEEAVLRAQLTARWTCAQQATSAGSITPAQLEDLVAKSESDLLSV
jgi:hypothetical protein